MPMGSSCGSFGFLLQRERGLRGNAGTLTRSTTGQCGNVDTFHYGAMRDSEHIRSVNVRTGDFFPDRSLAHSFQPYQDLISA